MFILNWLYAILIFVLGTAVGTVITVLIEHHFAVWLNDIVYRWRYKKMSDYCHAAHSQGRWGKYDNPHYTSLFYIKNGASWNIASYESIKVKTYSEFINDFTKLKEFYLQLKYENKEIKKRKKII